MPGVPPDTVAQVKTRLKTLFNRGRRSRSRQPQDDQQQQEEQAQASSSAPAPASASKPSPAIPDPEPAGPLSASEPKPTDTNSSELKDTLGHPAPPPPVTVPTPTEPKVDEHGMSATSGPLGDHLAGEEFGIGAHDEGEEEVVGGEKTMEGVKPELEGGNVGGGKGEEEGVIKPEGEVAEKDLAKEGGQESKA